MEGLNERLTPEELMTAADEADRLAGTFRAVLHIGQLMRRVGSIIQAENEARARQAQAVADAGEARGRLNHLLEECERVNAVMDKREKDVEAKANKTLLVAQNQAAALISKAEGEAEQHRKEKQVEAEGLIRDAINHKATLTMQAAEAEERLKSAVESATTKAAELAGLEGKLAAARKALQSLLAG